MTTKRGAKPRKPMGKPWMYSDRRLVARLAAAAGCPSGWYEGPWFDDRGKIRRGVPPCLVKLVALVELSANLINAGRPARKSKR